MWSERLYFQEFRNYQKQQGLQPSHGKPSYTNNPSANHTDTVTNIAQVISIKFLNMLTLYPKLLLPSYLNLKPLITAVAMQWDFCNSEQPSRYNSHCYKHYCPDEPRILLEHRDARIDQGLSLYLRDVTARINKRSNHATDRPAWLRM